MYFMRNGIKYANYSDIPTEDNYDEIYVVYVNKAINLNKWLHIDELDFEIRLSIPYYYSLINETIKYIDNEIFIPIKKFITHKSNYHYDFYSHCLEYVIGLYDIDIKPHEYQKITTCVIIRAGNDVKVTQDNNSVRIYHFDRHILVISETESIVDNIESYITINIKNDYNVVLFYQLYQKN